MLTTIAFLCIAAPAEITLRFAPPLGTRFTYEQTMDFVDQKDKSKTSMVDKFDCVVRQKNSRGELVTEMAMTPLMVTLDGQKVPPPKGIKSFLIKETRSALGALILRSEMPTDTFNLTRYAIMTCLMFKKTPVVEGERWRYNISEIEDFGTPPAIASFRLMEVKPVDKPKTAVLELQYEEIRDKDPMSATGKAEVDIETGITTLLDLAVDSAPIPGGEEGLQDLHLTWKLVSLKPAPQTTTKKAP